MIDSKKINNYLAQLTDVHNNVNRQHMVLLRKAIQKGVFSNDELLFLRRYMIKKNIDKEYDKELLNINFGKFLRNMQVLLSYEIKKAHAHHILYKCGIGKKQKDLVKIGQAILCKYGIDYIVGLENLVWAPNIQGQHTKENLQKLVEALIKADADGTDYCGIKRILKYYGEEASQR